MFVSFLQFKPELGNVKENISRIQNLLYSYLKENNQKPDLLVIPELANSGYLFASFEELNNTSEEAGQGDFYEALQKISDNENINIVAGFNEKSREDYFNSAYIIRPNGKFDVYRKLHLFDEEKKWFKPGNKLGIYSIEVNGEKINIGVMICFDWFFPETARSLALAGADIICHPANLVMPYCQRAMFARALENQVFTITANRIGKDINGDKDIFFTGESVILDPKGNYLARAKTDSEEIQTVDINPLLARNKFLNPNNNIFADRRVDVF